jgi:aerobic-type carbon monoxide dehydrogenase small subunit (CoxS/CutS family)
MKFVQKQAKKCTFCTPEQFMYTSDIVAHVEIK